MRAKGFDVHKYYGEIDFLVAKNAGLEFGLVRAGGGYTNTGVPFEDNWFWRNKVECPKYLKTGYWWYFTPLAKWVEQAETFRDLIKGQVMHIRPIVDVEEWADANGTKIHMDVLQARLKVFLDILEAEFGVKPIIYTRTTVWNPYYGNPTWAKDYPLWIARYPFTQPQSTDVLDLCQVLQPYTPSLGLPAPWNAVQTEGWTIWQCSADENEDGEKYGIPLPPEGTLAVDLNLANGTIEELLEKVGMETNAPPPTSGGLMLRFVNTGGDTSHIRLNPAITTNIVGSLPNNAVVIALEMRFAGGYIWIKYAINPAWLLAGKTASEGWSALSIVSGVPYIDFYDAIPCEEFMDYVTKEEMDEAISLAIQEAIENLPPVAEPAYTHKIIPTAPLNGIKLRYTPDGGEAAMLIKDTPVRLLKTAKWKNHKLYGTIIGQVWVTGWMLDTEVVSL